MMTLKSFAFLGFLLIARTALGGELHQVKMPEEKMIGKTHLQLNGMGLRDVTAMNIVAHVYVAGLYLEKKSESGEEILKSAKLKSLKMHFVRSVSAKDLKKNWQKGFDDNCAQMCESFAPKFGIFKDLLTDVKEGDEMSFNFTSQGLEVYLNDKKLKQIDGADFATVILANWIGEKPVTADLKKSLLTNKN